MSHKGILLTDNQRAVLGEIAVIADALREHEAATKACNDRLQELLILGYDMDLTTRRLATAAQISQPRVVQRLNKRDGR